MSTSRLSPTELHALLYKFAASLDKTIDPALDSEEFKAFIKNEAFLFLKNNNQKFIITPMCKDARTPSNNYNLLYIGEMLKKLLENYRHYDGTVLIPLYLCRGFLRVPVEYLGREHAVLIELNLKTLQLQVHDSQGNIPKLFYFDINIGNKLLKYENKNYHAYGVQWFNDDVSCGYYTFLYAKHIILQGNSEGLKKISLNLLKFYNNKFKFLHSFGINISADCKDKKSLNTEHHEIEIDGESFTNMIIKVPRLKL